MVWKLKIHTSHSMPFFRLITAKTTSPVVFSRYNVLVFTIKFFNYNIEIYKRYFSAVNL